jgi:uncharacterized coiled-coil DUF342 family protein
MSTSPNPAQGISASTTEVLAATIAAAVERQLTQYVSTMAKQVEAARQAAEQNKHELRAEFDAQLSAVMQRLDADHQRAEQYQQSLQHALEAKLIEFAQHQRQRLDEVENRLLETPAGGSAFDSNELATLRDQIDSQSAAAHARIDELHKATRRFDEQAAALVQHVNDTTIALAQRMDEGNQSLAGAVEERLAFVRSTLEAVAPEVQRQLTEHNAMLVQRIDFTEHKVTDRMLAMEDRINEQNGTKMAHLEATIGRIGAGFDDAIGALSQRMLELENRLYETHDVLGTLTERVNKVDENALNEVREQLSAAVGEAMLVRIELDRVTASTDEKIDKATIRMAEIEALLTDEMDVSASVQLERLEEIERALVELNPDQFVRKTDPTISGGTPGSAPLNGGAGGMGTPVLPHPSLSTPPPPSSGPTTTSEHSLSSF